MPKDDKEAKEITTRQELISAHERLCEKARRIIEAKNCDYSSRDDLFHNFRQHGRYGICVRMSDKLARLERFAERGTFTVEESAEDSVLDLINYAILYLAFK